ncbi:hypothetical protein AAC387_Pa01g2513 [Persea americana]
MDRKKLLLQSWSPSQKESVWPSIAPVWIKLKGLPYHCWSQNIILSLASSIGQPLKLDAITMAQRIHTFARVLVNLDLSKPKPPSILVDLHGEQELEIEVVYENSPCPIRLLVGHPNQTCLYSMQPYHPKPAPPVSAIATIQSPSNPDPKTQIQPLATPSSSSPVQISHQPRLTSNSSALKTNPPLIPSPPFLPSRPSSHPPSSARVPVTTTPKGIYTPHPSPLQMANTKPIPRINNPTKASLSCQNSKLSQSQGLRFQLPLSMTFPMI